MKGENLQTIFDETYDNYLDDVYRGKERPKAQPGMNEDSHLLINEGFSFSFRKSVLFSTRSTSWC